MTALELFGSGARVALGLPLVISCLSLSAPVAHAGTVSFTKSTGTVEARWVQELTETVIAGFPVDNTYPDGTLAQQRTLDFPAFDTSLGTLNSARWDVFAEFVLNTQAAAACVSALKLAPGLKCWVGAGIGGTRNVPRVYLGPGQPIFGTSDLLDGRELIYGPVRTGGAGVGNFNDTFDCLVDDASRCFNQTVRRADSTRTVIETDPTDYLTGPSISMDFQTRYFNPRTRCSVTFSLAASCIGFLQVKTTGLMTATLTYDYTPHGITPIPVPASMGFALGVFAVLGGMSWMRRRG